MLRLGSSVTQLGLISHVAGLVLSLPCSIRQQASDERVLPRVHLPSKVVLKLFEFKLCTLARFDVTPCFLPSGAAMRNNLLLHRASHLQQRPAHKHSPFQEQ